MAEISDLELGNFVSQIFAINHALNTCDIHERCDGSCRDGRPIRFQPVIIGTPKLRMDMTPGPFDGSDERTAPLTIDESLGAFAYSALSNSKTRIRLLRIKKAIFRADPVDCELISVALDQAPNYGALSYCWGSELKFEKILCNGKILIAGATLEEALKRYRASFGVGSDKEEYLWADAICINQDDMAEKSDQILLMKDIYSKAQTVYVDLGDVQPSWFSVLTLMERTVLSGKRSKRLSMKPTSTEASSLPDPHKPEWNAYWYTFSRPWFTRTWIVQEITLAKTAKVMFGRFVFDWERLEESNKVLAENGHINARMTISPPPVLIGLLNFTKLQVIKRSFSNGTLNPLQLLQLTRDFDCSEPKDKIFALIALMGDFGKVVGSYAIPVALIYTHFAAALLSCGMCIPLLDHAGLQRRHLDAETLPSWVPDWAAQSVHEGPKVISTLRPVPYRASASLPAIIRPLGNWTARDGLHLSGMFFDKLKFVHDIVKTSDTGDVEDFLDRYSRTRKAFEDSLELLSSVYSNPEETFCDALLMDDHYTGGNAIVGHSPITDPVATHHEFIEMLNNKVGKGIYFPTSNFSAAQTYNIQVVTACSARRFAVTEKGFMALVSPATVTGDWICIVFGATVPYILRQTIKEGRFQLVGDAYVHGIMYGEALSEDTSPSDIILI